MEKMTLEQFLNELKHKAIKIQLNVYTEDSFNANMFNDTLSVFNYWINKDEYLPLKIINVYPYDKRIVINLEKLGE